MRLDFRKTLIFPLVATLPMSTFAQKVKVGYDKGADFQKFKSYTWAELTTIPTRPLLYASIVSWVDDELKTKGFMRTENSGDLTLVPAGGVDFGLNAPGGAPILSSLGGPPPAIDATMWTGASGSSSLMATYVPQGTLILAFVDRAANKMIWTGTATEKLDIEKKSKSLELVAKSVTKLLRQFPPLKK